MGAALGSLPGGLAILPALQIGATVGGILDAITGSQKKPKARQDRGYSGSQYGTGIYRVWGSARLDNVFVMWVGRNKNGSYLSVRNEGGNKKKGTPGTPHAHATYALGLAETGFTFPDGSQLERPLTVDRWRMGDLIVYTNSTASPIAAYSSAKTYRFGDSVQATNGLYYQSKADGNTGHTPQSNPDWWGKVSTTKKNQHFDLHPASGESTFTMAASPVMVDYDGASNTSAGRGLTYFTVSGQDLLQVGNTLPTNHSVEVHTAPVTDADFLSDQFRFAGLAPSEFDVSVCTAPLLGIVTTGRSTPQDNITNFLLARSYDVVERDGKVVVVKRGGAIVRTVSDEDLGAESGGRAGSNRLPRALTADRTNLPSELTVTYMSASQNFRRVGAKAVWEDAASFNPVTFDSGMTLTDDEAAEMALRLLNVAYIEQGDVYGPIHLPIEYADLSPADPIELSVDGEIRRFRIVRHDLTPSTQTFGLIPDEPDVLNQSAKGDPGVAGLGGDGGISAIAAFVASPPIDLTDQYATFPGFYPFVNDAEGDVSGTGYYSFDDFATTAISFGPVTVESCFGPTTSALAAHAAGYETVSSTAYQPTIAASMVLYPTSEALARAGNQVALIGDEWVGIVGVGAPTATQGVGPGLLRGVHGSPTGTHVAGETLAVAPTVASTAKIRVDPAYVGQTVYVRVVPDGQEISDVASVSCVIRDPKKPYATPTTPIQESPAPAPDGVRTTFTLSHAPLAGTLILTRNGAQQTQGTDFTLSGVTITFTAAPGATDMLIATYSFSS